MLDNWMIDGGFFVIMVDLNPATSIQDQNNKDELNGCNFFCIYRNETYVFDVQYLNTYTQSLIIKGPILCLLL